MAKAITNAVLDAKLDSIKEILDRYVARFEKHLEDDLKVGREVDRLSQIESNRKWHLRAIWGAMLTMVTMLIVKFAGMAPR